MIITVINYTVKREGGNVKWTTSNRKPKIEGCTGTPHRYCGFSSRPPP